MRINLLNIHEKFNRIDEEHLQSEEEYENCINLLQTLNEESKVGLFYFKVYLNEKAYTHILFEMNRN